MALPWLESVPVWGVTRRRTIRRNRRFGLPACFRATGSLHRRAEFVLAEHNQGQHHAQSQRRSQCERSLMKSLQPFADKRRLPGSIEFRNREKNASDFVPDFAGGFQLTTLADQNATKLPQCRNNSLVGSSAGVRTDGAFAQLVETVPAVCPTATAGFRRCFYFQLPVYVTGRLPIPTCHVRLSE